MKKKDQTSDAVQDRERNDALNKSKNEGDEKLPGEYPPQEDMMNRRDVERVPLEEEDFSRGLNHNNPANLAETEIISPNEMEDITLRIVDELEQPAATEMERPVTKDIDLDDDNIEFVTGNESDVTKEDLQALGPKDLSMDMGEDEELLKNRAWPVDMAATDLDIPMAENPDDDMDEAIGPEDEENDFYSLGGDRHEDNMEGR